MYRKIMIPLDGSELAECVLPHVEAITNGCGVPEVVFVRVVEHVDLQPDWDYAADKELRQSMDAEIRARAEDYLREIASRVNYQGAKVNTMVISGKAAESLSDYAQESDTDLIVIATHGRSGVSRWIWGSVADRLLRSSKVPVLMVRPAGCAGAD